MESKLRENINKASKLSARINNGELSLKQLLNEFSNPGAWIALDKKVIPGVQAMWLLKLALDFFPHAPTQASPKSIKQKFESLLKSADVTMSKVLMELDEDQIEIDEEEHTWSDNSIFMAFKRSANYKALFRLVRNQFSLIKDFELNKVIKGLDARHEHIDDLVFYAKTFHYFLANWFWDIENRKITYIQICHPSMDNQNIHETIRRTRFKKFIEFGVQMPNFYLDLQQYWVKHAPDPVTTYMEMNYKKRTNFIETGIERRFPRYIHLMWPVFEKTFKEKKISNIENSNFKGFVESRKKNVLDFLSNQSVVLDIFDVLFFDLLIKIYFEKYLGFKSWERVFKFMSIEEMLKKSKNTGCPLVGMINRTLYGVFFKRILYFGNIFQAYAKYKLILTEEFESQLKTWETGGDQKRTTQTCSTSDFYVFREIF